MTRLLKFHGWSQNLGTKAWFCWFYRGLAVEDPTAEHGLRLTIEDYPFANDGLILWDAIKQWVSDYVNHYYPEPSLVQSDGELQAWWTEVRTKGHADKKDEPWWPVLKTPENLIHILTTIIWVTAGHHAAVNFGQYMFAGYFPNRPTIAQTNMPTSLLPDSIQTLTLTFSHLGLKSIKFSLKHPILSKPQPLLSLWSGSKKGASVWGRDRS